MNIGLVAHDSKKKLMQNLCIAYRGILSKHEVYATSTTGRLVEEVTNLTVHKFHAGHLGGVEQMCSQVEQNQIDMVIFLRDAQEPKMHEPDVKNIFRLCDMHNIPVALYCIQRKLPLPGFPTVVDYENFSKYKR